MTDRKYPPLPCSDCHAADIRYIGASGAIKYSAVAELYSLVSVSKAMGSLFSSIGLVKAKA